MLVYQGIHFLIYLIQKAGNILVHALLLLQCILRAFCRLLVINLKIRHDLRLRNHLLLVIHTRILGFKRHNRLLNFVKGPGGLLITSVLNKFGVVAHSIEGFDFLIDQCLLLL